MCSSLWSSELQHRRLLCPLLTPGVCSNTCPLNRWCHPIISFSVALFSFCLQSFSPLGSFQMSRLYVSGGQSVGVSASTSVLPVNIQDWFPLGLTGLILWSKGLSRTFTSTTVWKHQFFNTQDIFMVQLSHLYITIGKTIALTIWTFVSKAMSLLSNMRLGWP